MKKQTKAKVAAKKAPAKKTVKNIKKVGANDAVVGAITIVRDEEPSAELANKNVAASARVTKCDQVLELLRRKGGVTSAELMTATGWQAHSVRGFLAGTVRKKMGLPLTSAKSETGERTYAIAS